MAANRTSDGTGQEGAESLFSEALARLLEGRSSLGLALSGGSDSTAMLLLALREREKTGLQLFAATVDHGLRAEARAEAEAVAALCADRGVPHEILIWGRPKPEGNLQAAAREARSRLLADWGRRLGLRDLALGHTLDDVAETFLMRLARGSGVDGLAQMAEAREQSEVGAPILRLIRPMLGLRREALRAVCRAEGVSWFDDPSNEDARFTRSRARAALGALEELGLGPERLARTAASMARAREALEAGTAALLRAAGEVEPDFGLVRLQSEALAGAPRELALRALARALEWVAGAPYPPRLDALEAALDAMLSAGEGRTLHGAVLTGDRRRGNWVIFREPAAAEPRQKLEGGAQVWDGRFRFSGPAAGAVFVGALGREGRLAVELRLREEARAAPPGWISAPVAARQSAPAAFDAEGRVLHAPAAGVFDASLTLEAVQAPSWG